MPTFSASGKEVFAILGENSDGKWTAADVNINEDEPTFFEIQVT